MGTRSPIVLKEAFVPPNVDMSVLAKLDKIIADSQSEEKLGYPKYVKTIYDIKENDIEKIKEQKHSRGIIKPVGALRGYQTYGVSFLLTVKNGLLTDSVGLGKTSQVASMINCLTAYKSRDSDQPFRYLYLTEVGLVPQAQNELIRFTGKYVPTTTGDTKVFSEFHDWVSENEDSLLGIVASYSAVTQSYSFMTWLHSYVKKYGKLDYVFIDEGSVLSNNKTGTTKAFKLLRDKFVKNRVVMNATPFEKSITSMYNQLDFAFPSTLPLKGKFEDLFVNKNYLTGEIYGYKDPESFKKAIRYLAFGQTRKELGVDIKNSTCNLVMYRLSYEQSKLLGQTRYAEYVFDDPTWLDYNLTVNERTNPKLLALRRVMDNCVLGGKVMVYCKFKEAQRTIQTYLNSLGISSIILNGDDNSAVKKAKKVEQFNNEGIQVMITNLKKGLNLGHVNHLIFYSFSGNSGLMNQVEGRMVRSQKIVNKNIYILMASTHEHRSLSEASKNTLDRLAHTKEEVSILNDFLSNGKNLKEAIQQAKDGVKESPIFVSCVRYDDGLKSRSLTSFPLDKE